MDLVPDPLEERRRQLGRAVLEEGVDEAIGVVRRGHAGRSRDVVVGRCIRLKDGPHRRRGIEQSGLDRPDREIEAIGDLGRVSPR